ncbi:hypothetical protein HanIR_Chr08g0354641 [Helianthus annuus]|nr:hypothetical protein HanIR_Chr08g0354641 [Helianthus annuus]
MIRNHPIDLFVMILCNQSSYIRCSCCKHFDHSLENFTTHFLEVPGAQDPFLVIISRA